MQIEYTVQLEQTINLKNSFNWNLKLFLKKEIVQYAYSTYISKTKIKHLKTKAPDTRTATI